MKFREMHPSCLRHDQEVINIFHAKHISGGPQAIKVKVYSPSTNEHTPRRADPWVPSIPTSFLGDFCLIICNFWIQDYASLLPPLSCEDEWINTHHENKPLSMEDTDYLLSLYEQSRHTKTDVYLKILKWHMQIYLERQGNTAYR